MKLKNLVAPKSRGLQKQLNPKFGLSMNLLIRALHNDKTALKKLADMGKEGAMISDLAPQVKERALQAIQGTQDLNQALSEVLKAAGKSGLAIDKAVNSTELANTNLLHQQAEMEIDFTAAKEREEVRHNQATNYIKMKAWLDKHFLSVDGDYKLLQAELMPEIKQQSINLQHDKDMGHYYLEVGSDARQDLKPKKEYAKPSIIQRIKETILGF